MSALQQFFPIDVVMSQIITKETQPRTLTWQTGSKVNVKPITAEGKEVPLDVKGVRYAVKRAKNSYLGNELKYSENSFTPAIFALINGGTLIEEPSGTFKSYEPPAIGEEEAKVKFDLITYSANYNEAGDLVNYMKTTYYHCEGTVTGYDQEDDKFFAPEFTIMSTPPKGTKPYKMEVIEALPAITFDNARGAFEPTLSIEKEEVKTIKSK
ncbi:MAG: hypothetical protein RSC84_02560 [Peptostreptococcaceae bacterium]|uniref:hypothetical protein n=1 Tax=Clostridium sp. TaxID=1506 RepID=UPI0030630C9D